MYFKQIYILILHLDSNQASINWYPCIWSKTSLFYQFLANHLYSFYLYLNHLEIDHIISGLFVHVCISSKFSLYFRICSKLVSSFDTRVNSSFKILHYFVLAFIIWFLALVQPCSLLIYLSLYLYKQVILLS